MPTEGSKKVASIKTEQVSASELNLDFEFDENTQEGRDIARQFALRILEEYSQQVEAVEWANNLLVILDNLPELK